MLLLSRPPYLRWIAAIVVVGAAVGLEISDRSTEPIPFAARAIAKGEAFDADLIEWRFLPSGSIVAPALTGLVATAPINAGDPITTSVAGAFPAIPDGWWAVPVDLPIGVPIGSKVRLIIEGGVAYEGLVVAESTDDGFGIPTMGSVALPAATVDAVAQAAAEGRVAVAVAP